MEEDLTIDTSTGKLNIRVADYYAPSGPPVRPVESFNIQLESTGTQFESSKCGVVVH